MTYARLPIVCSDYAVGLRTVNQARANNQAHVDFYNLRHAIVDSPPLQRVGCHDDPLIARAVARYEIDSSVTPSALRTAMPTSIVGAATRLGTGRWRIPVAVSTRLGARATPTVASSVLRQATCFVSTDPVLGTTVTVTTFDVSAAAAVDCPFSLELWAM